MFGFLTKKPPVPPEGGLYSLLFGDAPWDVFAKNGPGVWADFAQAHAHAKADRVGEATAILLRITEMPGLESRQYLQAWHFLRTLRQEVPDVLAKNVLGVVVEMPVKGGRDVLAAYGDRRARYLNHSGASVIWESPGQSDVIDAAIDRVIAEGQRLANVIGFWGKDRLPPPSGDAARLSLLAPGGLLFGEGPVLQLTGNQMSMQLLGASANLLGLLVKRPEARG